MKSAGAQAKPPEEKKDKGFVDPLSALLSGGSD